MDTTSHDWAGLFRHVGQWAGVVHLDDGPEFGIPRGTVRDRGRREAWLQPFPNRPVYLAPGAPFDLAARTWAALRAVGPPVALARETAAGIWDIADLPQRPVQLVVPHDRHVKSTDGYRLESSRRLDGRDVVLNDRQPVTTPDRTVADLTRRYGRRRGRGMAIAGIRKQLVTLPGLETQRERLGRGCAGVGNLDAVLTDLRRSGRLDSNFEWDVRDGVESHGIRLLPGVFPFRCDDGVVVHLDIVVDGYWVAIECDGFGVHTKPETFTTDRVRWTQVTRHWQVVWVDEVRLRNDLAGIVADVRAAMRRTEGRPPPVPAGCGCRTCRR